MRKSFIALLLTACLLVETVGCTITTTGEASWEVYGGVRTRQHSDQPAKVEIQSSIIDSLMDGKIPDAE